MKENNVIVDKTFLFAVRIVKLHKHLVKQFREYELSAQILRSGTSIGSNVEEAVGGVSRKDFLNKIGIAYKEARETHYWLRLLHATEYITDAESKSLIKDCQEILKIISKIQITTKENS